MNPRVVSFHYTLKDKGENMLDSSIGNEPMIYLEGASQIIPGLEEAMRHLKVGDKRAINIAASEAYGERNQELIVQVPLAQMPKNKFAVGDQFEVDSQHESPVFTVVAMTETHVTLDGNHPLAGQELFFDVEIIDVRNASAEEIKHGHAHGPGGHSH